MKQKKMLSMIKKGFSKKKTLFCTFSFLLSHSLLLQNWTVETKLCALGKNQKQSLSQLLACRSKSPENSTWRGGKMGWCRSLIFFFADSFFSSSRLSTLSSCLSSRLSLSSCLSLISRLSLFSRKAIFLFLFYSRVVLVGNEDKSGGGWLAVVSLKGKTKKHSKKKREKEKKNSLFFVKTRPLPKQKQGVKIEFLSLSLLRFSKTGTKPVMITRRKKKRRWRGKGFCLFYV